MANGVLLTAEKNKQNRIALFEVCVRELLELMAKETNLSESSQPICEEVIIGDQVVQLQLHIVRHEEDFIPTFQTNTVTTI